MHVIGIHDLVMHVCPLRYQGGRGRREGGRERARVWERRCVRERTCSYNACVYMFI